MGEQHPDQDQNDHSHQGNDWATPAWFIVLAVNIRPFAVHSDTVTSIDTDSPQAALDRMRASMAIVVAFLLAVLGGASAARAQGIDRWFTTSDGIRLHYSEVGQGPTLVFVPGWTMPGWIWQAQVSDFSRRFRVVTFDPRSQGESQIAPTGHDPFRRGQDIAELIAQLGPSPVVLIGWSLGVLDVLAYVHENGDRRLAGLVLVDNSVGEDPPPSVEGSLVAHHPRRRRPGVRERPATREDTMRSFVAGMFVHPQSPAFIERLTDACLRTPAPIAAALLAYPVPRSFWRDAVYSTERPVLYIVRPRLAGQAANLGAHHPSAETAVLGNVGHAMFVDDPAQFDGILQSFLFRRVWH